MMRLSLLASLALIACGLSVSTARAGDACCETVVDPCCAPKEGLLQKLFKKKSSCCEPAPVCCEPAPAPVCCEPEPVCDPCADPCAKKSGLLSKLFPRRRFLMENSARCPCTWPPYF